MIEFFVVDEGGDPRDPDDRQPWFGVEDGSVRFADDSLTDPRTGSGYEAVVDFEKGKLEGLTDPVSVVRRFQDPPVVAAIPHAHGDGHLFAGQDHRFGDEGELGAFERFEWEQYTNLEEVEPDGIRGHLEPINSGSGAPVREHVVPDRYSVVEIGTRGGNPPGSHSAGLCRLDTSTGEFLGIDDEDGAAHMEHRISRLVPARPTPFRDPVRLLRALEAKLTRWAYVDDDEADRTIGDPRAILPKPNHPDHADVDLLEAAPEPSTG